MFHPLQHRPAVMARLEASQHLTTIFSNYQITLTTSTHGITLNKPISTRINSPFNVEGHLAIHVPSKNCSSCIKPSTQCCATLTTAPARHALVAGDVQSLLVQCLRMFRAREVRTVDTISFTVCSSIYSTPKRTSPGDTQSSPPHFHM